MASVETGNPVKIPTSGKPVSGVWTRPPAEPRAAVLLAHGAGARRDHPSMEALALALAAGGFLVLRFNFPYTESGRKVPDRSDVLVQTWLDVWAWSVSDRRLAGIPVLAGGRSMGGRMASMAASAYPDRFIPDGLVFFAYPLHPPGRMDKLRAEHLLSIRSPMLFLSGTRDTMAGVELMDGVVKNLGKRAKVHWIDGADHGFHALKRSGRTDEDVHRESVEILTGWLGKKVVVS